MSNVYCNGEIELDKTVKPEDAQKIIESFPEGIWVRNRVSVWGKYIRVEDSIGWFDVKELEHVERVVNDLGYIIQHTPATMIGVYGSDEGMYVYDDRGFTYLDEHEKEIYLATDDELLAELRRRGKEDTDATESRLG